MVEFLADAYASYPLDLQETVVVLWPMFLMFLILLPHLLQSAEE